MVGVDPKGMYCLKGQWVQGFNYVFWVVTNEGWNLLIAGLIGIREHPGSRIHVSVFWFNLSAPKYIYNLHLLFDVKTANKTRASENESRLFPWYNISIFA